MMDDEKKSAITKRLNLLFTVVFLALSILIVRLSYVQLKDGEKYRAKAESNRFDTLPVPAPRGFIYDRNNELLVTNKPSYTITFTLLDQKQYKQDPAKVVKQIADLLSPVIGKSSTELLKDMDVPKDLLEKMGIPEDTIKEMNVGDSPNLPISTPRRIVTKANDKEVAFVKEHQNELPGVNVVVEPVRDYVKGTLASHVIGYLGGIPKSEYEAYKQKGYRNDAVVGLSGVERQYEDYLRGKDGSLKVEVNMFNQPIKLYDEVKPVRGDDVYLNIDAKLQQATEQALADQVKWLNANRRHIDNAMAVAMDPNTGDVLALASYPPYNPNDWVGGISDANYKKFIPAELNRVIQSPVAPGSTVKMGTVLLGLKHGVINQDTVFYDAGRLQVGWTPSGEPNYIYSWDHGGLGALDPRKALAVSSNVYMFQVALRLGGWLPTPPKDVNYWLQHDLPAAVHTFDEFFKQFGLGVKTGIDLPGEEAGFMADAQYLADLAYTAIGQHESYTPIELVQYVSVLANGGKRMEPHVVKEIKDPNGKVVLQNTPKVLNTVPLNPNDLQVVREGMRDDVIKSYGTAYSAFVGAPYSVAAKTGTSETSVHGFDNSWIVGYAPYDHPQIAFAICVPGGGSGTDSTLPIARKMLDAYFNASKK
jgi:penicillin-binding protein 2